MNGHQVHKTHADPQPRREGRLITSASPPAPTLKFRSGPACQGSQSHCPHPGKLRTYSTHWLCSSSRNPLRTQVGRFSVLENPLKQPHGTSDKPRILLLDWAARHTLQKGWGNHG